MRYGGTNRITDGGCGRIVGMKRMARRQETRPPGESRRREGTLEESADGVTAGVNILLLGSVIVGRLTSVMGGSQ